MITAAVAPVVASSNHEAAWATVFALLTVFAIVAVLYQHERRADRHQNVINEHDEQLGLLAGRIQALAEWLGVEITDPVEDDSPEAMAMTYGHDCTHTSMWHGADGCNVPGCLCAYMSWDESDYDEAATDEIPIVLPDTEPMAVVNPTPAVQARRDAAWDETRPSPVPRYPDEFPHPVDSDERKAKNAADIEERLKRFNFTGGRK